MKRWQIVLIVILSVCGIAIGYALNNYYAPPAERQAYTIPRHHDDTLRIAYIGDSWAAFHNEHRCSLSQIISNRLQRPVKVTSFGLPGKTSKEIYESLFNHSKMRTLMTQGCDFCFISAGINDTYKKMSTEYYKKSMDFIIQFMLTNNIRPIILEIPDYDIIRAYNRQQPSRRWLRMFSILITGTPIDCKNEFRNTLMELIFYKNYHDSVDLISYQEWNLHYVDDLKAYYVGDGMHLNQKGYDKLDSCLAMHIIVQTSTNTANDSTVLSYVTREKPTIHPQVRSQSQKRPSNN